MENENVTGVGSAAATAAPAAVGQTSKHASGDEGTGTLELRSVRDSFCLRWS